MKSNNFKDPLGITSVYWEFHGLIRLWRIDEFKFQVHSMSLLYYCFVIVKVLEHFKYTVSMIEHWMNGKEHTCIWNLVILLAEGTSGTSGDELTMPKLAGRKKFMMILLVLSVSCKISIQACSSLCIHLLFSRNNRSNNEWALGTGYFVVRVWMFCFIFLRPSGLGLTCGFCAQNMKVQLFSLNCIWAKCVHLVHVCVFKTDMKKRDFSVPPRNNCNTGFCTVLRKWCETCV